MRRTLISAFFVSLLLFSLLVQLVHYSPKCAAQLTVIRITHEEYGWTDDMKRLGMATQETGLIFKITIYNNGQLPLEIGYPHNNVYPNPFNEINSLYINIEVVSTDSQPHYDETKKIIFDSDNPLYLPPKESYSRLVQFDHYGSALPIGSYTAKLAYSTYGFSSGNEGTPIEPYPFNFKIASTETLENTIRQDSGSFISVGDINITLFQFTLGGTITLISIGVPIAIYLWKRKKK
jgi:hypothetical protein